MGFILEKKSAELMLASDPRNKDVIFPYINGDDINSDPKQSASRYVICFWDWPENRAKEYPLPWNWVEKNVRKKREKNKSLNLQKKWWIFERARYELYKAIGRGSAFIDRAPMVGDSEVPMREVIATSRHTKYFNPSFIKNDAIFSDATVIFASDDLALFAFLNSVIAEIWVQKFSSTMGHTIRFTPSDSFETLPKSQFSNNLYELGAELLMLRNNINIKRQIGTSAVYNLFHSPLEVSDDIVALRDLHKRIDAATCSSYGWSDLGLSHDFFMMNHLPVSDQIRYSIQEHTRIEILERLSKLNKQRFIEESSETLCAGNASRISKKELVVKKYKNAEEYLQTDFNFDGPK
jgi:hypothetical protein